MTYVPAEGRLEDLQVAVDDGAPPELLELRVGEEAVRVVEPRARWEDGEDRLRVTVLWTVVIILGMIKSVWTF